MNSAERMQSFLVMDELSLKKIMTMQLILSQVNDIMRIGRYLICYLKDTQSGGELNQLLRSALEKKAAAAKVHKLF